MSRLSWSKLYYNSSQALADRDSYSTLYVDFPKTQPRNSGKGIHWEMLFLIIDCMESLRGLHMNGTAGYLRGNLVQLRQRQPWTLLDVSFFLESHISASLFLFCDPGQLCILRIMCDPKPLFDQLFQGPIQNALGLKQIEVWCDMDSPSVYATIYPKIHTISMLNHDSERFLYVENRGGKFSMPYSSNYNCNV